jgi:heat shock protein HtpX
LKTALLLGALSGFLLVIGRVLGGETGMLLALIMAAVMNIGSYWFSDKIVLRMYKAQPVGPDHPLARMTARLAQRAGLPMPKVYIIPDMSPNAFATGRNPSHAAVAATEGIMRLLPENELEGVIAHELAHVKAPRHAHQRRRRDDRAAITWIAQWACTSAAATATERGGSNIFAMLAMMILAPLAAGLIQAAISRSREFAADAGGAEIAGRPTAWPTRCSTSKAR